MSFSKSDVEKLFDDFIDALLEKDFARAASWCDTPCTIVRPTGPKLCDVPAQAAEDIKIIWDSYRDFGICGMRKHILDVRSYTEGLALVDVEWRLVDRDGRSVIRAHSTYGLRRDGAALKVMLIVSHDELFQRPVHARAEAASG